MMAAVCHRSAMPLAAMAGAWVMLVLLAACPSRDPRLLEPAAAAELMHRNRSNPEFMILDVRTPEEFSQGHIEGAVLLNYYSPDFRDRFAALDRGATLFVYCRSGTRPSHVLALADSLGFQRIFELRGGILAWKGAGMPLASGEADLKRAPGPQG